MPTIREIEPKILPLVAAINSLGICKTFSSCQGHFDENEQGFMDRNHADVRFDPLSDHGVIELFITYLITEFHNRCSFAPVSLKGHKLYAPSDDYSIDAVYIITLEPFDRFDLPSNKRKYIDEAIIAATQIVYQFRDECLE